MGFWKKVPQHSAALGGGGWCAEIRSCSRDQGLWEAGLLSWSSQVGLILIVSPKSDGQ